MQALRGIKLFRRFDRNERVCAAANEAPRPRATGFEHSVANMYYFPMALLLQASGTAATGADVITVADMFLNLGIVIAGNLAGGRLLVALVYWVIYLRAGRPPAG